MAILRRTFLLLTLSVAAACGGGDDGDDVTPIDGPAGIDAPACVLPAATTMCTLGADGPCTALCAQAYCHNFSQLPTPVCTTSCTVGSTDECPTGWTCNNMGRCRPP